MQHQSAFSIQATNKKNEEVYKIKYIFYLYQFFSIYFTKSLYFVSSFHDKGFKIIICVNPLVPTSILRIVFLITLTYVT